MSVFSMRPFQSGLLFLGLLIPQDTWAMGGGGDMMNVVSTPSKSVWKPPKVDPHTPKMKVSRSLAKSKRPQKCLHFRRDNIGPPVIPSSEVLTALPPEIVFACVFIYFSNKELGQVALINRTMWSYVKDFMQRYRRLCLHLGPERLQPFLIDNSPMYLMQQWTTLAPSKDPAPCRIKSFHFTETKTYREFSQYFTLGTKQFVRFVFSGDEANKLESAGVQDLVAAIQELGVRYFKLENHPSLKAPNVESLIEALPQGVVELMLSYLGMRTGTALVLAKALSKFPLTSLDISGNSISEEGLTTLAKNLPTTLEKLNLAQNDSINGVGIEALAEALLLNQNIKELYISGNALDGDKLKALFEILSKTELRVLDLSNNSLEDPGARALLDIISLTKIICLKISENYISPEVKAIFHGLRNANNEAIHVEVEYGG